MNTLELLTLKNTRFGDIEFDSREIVSFPEGLLGFPDEQNFILVSTPGASSFVWLQSLSNPSLAFLLVDPTIYVPTYRPSMIKGEFDQVLTTVNIPHGHPEAMSLNLAGPICIEAKSRKGKQIVLDNEAYTTKYRVFADESQKTRNAAA